MSKDAKADKPKPPEHVEVYFDSRDSGYWWKINGRFVKLKKSDIQMHFKAIGLRDDIYFDGMREIDWPLWNAQRKRLVDYAGELAGHRAGVFTDTGGRSYLVMNEAKGVFEDMPKKPQTPNWFVQFVNALLLGDQSNYFLYWLAIGLDSLRKRDFRPGQVVFLVGPSQCGKSLLQAIVTEVFGGRKSLPWEYMMGRTNFNQDLAGGEHWVIEDPDTTTDMRARRSFGNKLKECANNVDFRIRGLGKEAQPLPLFRRITVSVNDEVENVSVVPPLDPSIEDKVYLFKCDTVSVGNDRAKIWEVVKSEIPLIRAWLLKNFLKVPKDLRDDRYTIKAWHHPELKQMLIEMANEHRLLNIMDAALWSGEPPNLPIVDIKSVDLELQLKETKYAFEIEKMMRFPGACGGMLSKLVKQRPDRISKRSLHGNQLWTINPPVRENEEKPL